MRNPYMTVYGCVERLYQQYKKHGKLIIACDWDDTLFDLHNKGYTYEDTLAVLRRCNEKGFPIVIFTAAKQDRYDSIIDKATELGIAIYGINKNVIDTAGTETKVYYNILLDDKAGLSQAISILNETLDKIEKKEFYNEAERK